MLASVMSSPSSRILPGGDWLQADQRLGQLGLAVALHAGERVDLAGAHLERHAVDHDLGLVVDDLQARRPRAPPRRAVAGGLVDGELDRPADHQRGELVRRGVRGWRRRRPCRAGSP